MYFCFPQFCIDSISLQIEPENKKISNNDHYFFFEKVIPWGNQTIFLHYLCPYGWTIWRRIFRIRTPWSVMYKFAIIKLSYKNFVSPLSGEENCINPRQIWIPNNNDTTFKLFFIKKTHHMYVFKNFIRLEKNFFVPLGLFEDCWTKQKDLIFGRKFFQFKHCTHDDRKKRLRENWCQNDPILKNDAKYIGIIMINRPSGFETRFTPKYALSK